MDPTLSVEDPFIFGITKATVIWLLIFGIVRVLSSSVVDERIKFSRGSLAHRIYVSIYTVYCLTSGSQQFPTVQSYLSAMYRPPFDEYASLGVTSDQRVFFFMISGFEIADGIIRYFHGTLDTIFIVHHVLHLIAYAYGGLIWRQYGWGFLVHLILSEWRDIAYVTIKMLDQIRIQLDFLHYVDAICVLVVVPFLWKFAYTVCTVEDIDLIYKVSIIAYGIMLAKWFKDRLQWNWRKIQRIDRNRKSHKTE